MDLCEHFSIFKKTERISIKKITRANLELKKVKSEKRRENYTGLMFVKSQNQG